MKVGSTNPKSDYMTNQKTRKSERILKSWKGAESILKLNHLLRFFIIGLMGVSSVVLFIGSLAQNLILLILGIGVFVIWARLFILLLDAAILRTQQEREDKFNQKINTMLENELQDKLSKEMIADLSSKLIDAFSKYHDYGEH